MATKAQLEYRIAKLEREIDELRGTAPGKNAKTIAYLLDSAEALTVAAKCLTEIRHSATDEQEPSDK